MKKNYFPLWGMHSAVFHSFSTVQNSFDFPFQQHLDMMNIDLLVPCSNLHISTWKLFHNKIKSQIIGLLILFFTFSGVSNVFGQFPGNDNSAGVNKTFTVPAGVTSITATTWGAGGGGGGSNSDNNGGNGGGGAGGTTGVIVVTAGATFNYTVGAGGVGGAANVGPGGDGGLSNITSIVPATNMIANGGTGGRQNALALNTPTNSGGGSATGGTTNSAGGNGALESGSTGGNGGNSGTVIGIFGAGGLGRNNNSGLPGVVPGGGGGGGEYSLFINRAGGAGANGQVTFQYIGVTSISPNPVCTGSTITITGFNFAAGTTTVVINGTACTSVTRVSATQITAVVTAGTTSGNVVVTNPNGTNNGHSLTVNPAPAAIGGGAATVCTGITTPAFTNATAGGTWSITNGTGTATIDASTGVVTGVTAGIVTVVYTLGSCPVTKSLTVQQTPGAIGGGAPTVCVGASTLAFTNPNFGGTWSVVNGTGSATINNGTRILTGGSAGTVTVVYTIGSCAPATYTVMVNAVPAIMTQPVVTSICTTGTGTFNVVATGATTYQWRRNGANLTNTAPYSGVDTPTLTITNPTAATAGNFDVVISNANCSVTSTARVLTVTTVPGIVSTPIPANGATGVCYSGTGAVSNISWGAAANATSYDVYFGAGILPGGITANVLTNTYNTGALLANTTYYWRIVAKNSCGDAVTSAIFSFTTSAIACSCTPTSWKPNGLYINSVAFIGTLADPPLNNSTFSANGFQNFTTLPTKAIQVQGEGVNVIAHSTGVNFVRGTWKAWVDWSKDGIFQPATEEVYNIQGFAGSDATFGFVIPPTTLPGDYRIRLRVNNGYDYFFGDETFGFNFSPCDPFEEFASYDPWIEDYGETEDYLFTVVAKCNSLITSVTDGQNCGSGTVNLQAAATAGVTEFRWYTFPSGGSYTTSAVSGVSTTFTTPSLSTTTNYYVTAWNGTCETQVRTLVIAKINPTPVVSFTPSAPAVCGDSVILQITAGGDKETVHLINEHFEGGTLGVFSNINNDTNNVTVDGNTSWKNRTSTFVPVTNVWFPAVSSGVGQNKFALAYSDSKDPNYASTTVENSIALSNSVSTNAFLNLTLKLRLYYSRYFPDGYVDPARDEYAIIELSINGGTTYPIVLQSFISDVGISSKFAELSYDLSAYINQPNLKIRIRHRSFAGNGFLPDGVAVDDVELFGEKPLNTSFSYNTATVDAFTNAGATIPYISGTPATTIWIKPSPLQIENTTAFTIPVTATLSNGCSAVGSVSITNNTKTWNTASTDWGTNNWKPGGTGVPPIDDKCVIIKTPVNIVAATDAFAKNVRVESTGKLNINADASLTVTDAFINQATDADVIIASDASLKQITDNPVPPNSGLVTAKRNITLSAARQQYNYIISPLENQSLASIYKDSSGNPVTVPFVLYHNEATNKFYTSSGAYIRGRALAVKEPGTAFAPGTMSATFSGKLTNGAFTFGIANSNISDVKQGFNLTGNPYPSNIDLRKLYDINGGKTDPTPVTSPNISATFYLWDNTGNTIFAQQGNSYLGQSYAIFNVLTGSNGSGTPAGSGSKTPTKIVKVGQGFMTRSLMASYNLNFNNSIRTTAISAIDFFGKSGSTVQDDRYWLKMTAPSGITSTIAFVHFPGGNNLFGAEDSRTMGNSDAVYSIAEDEKLAIDGRSSLVNTDIIPLGTQHFADGNYVIAIDTAEGIFANGQNIYLKDKQTGIITNLSQGNYTFAAIAGESTGRFEIIYKPETVLSTDSTVKETFLVYRNGSEFVVRSSGQDITDLQLFDASGRLILERKGSQKELRFPAQQLSEGMFVVKATLKTGEILTRKIRK